MQNHATTAKLKLTKTVVTRYTKPQGPTPFMSTSDIITVPTTMSTMA
jgi:hypothetical protein